MLKGFGFIGFVLLVACSTGSSSTSAGTPNGGGCSDAGTCSGGICAQSQDFPSGYCTQGCTIADPSSCPAGSVCIDDVSGVPASAGVTAICYQSCQSDAECERAGYKCLEKSSHMVCRNGA